MDEGRQTEVPSALRAGRLEGISFPDLLWALCRRRSTGVLRIALGSAEKSLYLDRGRIVFASSSDLNDRLGELFLREGRVTLDRLELALGRLHTGKRLGTLLVESGALTADQLVQGVVAQVERIVLSLFVVEEGDYRFEEGPLPSEEVITLGMRTGELLLRGIRQIRSFGRIRRSVGGAQKVYGVTDTWRGVAEGLHLTAGEQQLLDRLRSGDVSIETLCRDVYLSNFEIYQTLLGFRVLGLVEEREPPRGPVGDATWNGVLGDEGFAELLVRLGRSGDTGVLYVTRGGQERTFHVSGGRCVFATSNEPDDGLVAYLLRRGVISLADREETAKRLLSNKRVGTILREIGVIDERDLREMVRRQLSEIVFDTFRWANADYSFVRGSLPTIEEITLEESLEALVSAGLRRIDSWSRVWNGCGGLETVLDLRPTYLSVLDSMQAGADEWQILAALKEPRTPREICRGSELGDFRVCQILWTLRILGAVGTASAESSAERPVTTGSRDTAVGCAAPDLDSADPWADAPIAASEPSPFLGAPVCAEPIVDDDDAPRDIPPQDEPLRIEIVREDAACLDPWADAPIEASEPPPVLDAPVYAEPIVDGDAAPADNSPPDEPLRFEIDREAAAAFDRRAPVPTAWADEDFGAPADTRLDATQLISREALENALRGDSAQERGYDGGESIDATQVISPDVLDAAQADLAATDSDCAAQPEDTGPISHADLAVSLEATLGPPVEARRVDRPVLNGEAWAAPVELDETLDRFNAAHRLVYRAVRSEIGAGATNFLRATCIQRAPEAAALVDGVNLSADGSWDPDGLRQAVVDGRVSDPWSAYLSLLEVEIDRIGEFLGAVRATDLRRQIESLREQSASRG